MPSEKTNKSTNEHINLRQQIIDDLQNMCLPTPLTILLFSKALRKPKKDEIQGLKEKEALLQKNITEVFTELLAEAGTPVKIQSDAQTDYFDHLQIEFKRIEDEVSEHNKEGLT